MDELADEAFLQQIEAEAAQHATQDSKAAEMEEHMETILKEQQDGGTKKGEGKAREGKQAGRAEGKRAESKNGSSRAEGEGKKDRAEQKKADREENRDYTEDSKSAAESPSSTQSHTAPHHPWLRLRQLAALARACRVCGGWART